MSNNAISSSGSNDDREVAPGSSVAWNPPSFEGRRHTRIGSSIIEQFVVGHGPADVLRELVQNEFDGGGTRLALDFRQQSLDVAGNGRGISPDGWDRLSVILGTGRVVGEGAADKIAPKKNGIGSKNFGLRSLFVFGDQIYVRSKGRVCLLDLQSLETGEVPDEAWHGEEGVRLHVPFRQQKFELLDAFTTEVEAKAFQIMASGVLATLVKLALPGKTQGIRELSLRSERLDRSLSWKQAAITLDPKGRGYAVTARKGKLTDKSGEVVEQNTFAEIEFGKKIEIPNQFYHRPYPQYFSEGQNRVRIAVSIPMKNRKLDADCVGYFFYPLQAPDAQTGCAISVCAPFELDNDRSNVLANSWNEWLMNEAAKLTVELLRIDWFERFGSTAFRALEQTGRAQGSPFFLELERLLKEERCWPSSAKNSERFVEANQLVIPTDPELFGFLGENRYLHPSIANDQAVQNLAVSAGAKTFTVASLIRLRSFGARPVGMKQKFAPGEADYYYTDFEASLKNADRQVKMAAALTTLSKKITPAGKEDLRHSTSTLSAGLMLKPASTLIHVPQDVWEVCPEPKENRLHPRLNDHKAITSLCRQFDEETWIIEACERARKDQISKEERNAIFNRLLTNGLELSRKAIQELRSAPIAKNRRGEWTRPDDMVVLYENRLGHLTPFLNLPAKEMMASPDLLTKLRVRGELSGRDLLAAARIVAGAPALASRFEQFILENVRLLSAASIEELSDVAFLQTMSNQLGKPSSLYTNTALNAICVSKDEIVAGRNDILYIKLGVREKPSADEIFDYITARRESAEVLSRPDLVYAALAGGLAREKRDRSEFQNEPILWLDGQYHRPKDVLVGVGHERFFDGVVPVFRGSADLGRIYISLGAKPLPEDTHWQSAFVAASDQARHGAPRRLLDIYRVRGELGLPPDLEDLECLLDNRGGLFSLEKLRQCELVENDYPALADQLKLHDSNIGTVTLNDKNRAFFTSLGIRPLSFVAGRGIPVFGSEIAAPRWFKSHHSDHIARLLRRPIFTKAIRAIALQQRYGPGAIAPATEQAIGERLGRIAGVKFFDEIMREYSVGGATYRVPVEVAIEGAVIGLITPRTRLDYEQLLAQVLAEVAGAVSLGQVRILTGAFFPLVLCRSSEEMEVYLERFGVVLESDSSDNDHFDDDVDAGTLGEDLIRQVVDSLAIDSVTTEPDFALASLIPDESGEVTRAPPLEARVSPLPVITEVDLKVANNSGMVPSSRLVDDSSGVSLGTNGWRPRTGSEVERDQEAGTRGEELIYLLELERVRKAGHSNPESVVTWTSRLDPGADHDIQSIDSKGRVKWLEVKSTTGTDGRFEWSRKEFEKALREKDRYELWRVYKVASVQPVAKCFVNPAKMLAGAKLHIELASFKASVENLSE